MLQRNVSHHGGGAEVAVCKLAISYVCAAGQDPAAGSQLGNVAGVILVNFAVDHRSKPVLALGGVTDLDGIGVGNQFIHKSVIYRLFYEHARGGRAFLTLQTKSRAHYTFCRQIQISIFRDNGGVLAAQLQDDRVGILAVGKLAVNVHTYFERTGECQARHILIGG